MYEKSVIAAPEPREAKRALTRGIELAKLLGSQLHIVTVSEPLPAYAGFMDSEMPGGREMLLKERNAFYSDLQAEGIQQATAAGIKVEGVVAEGIEVQAIVDHIVAWGADLLVIGRRHHSTMSRLWRGTVHNIAEKVRCSILAVY